jgi:hypothetical protein
MAKRAKAAKSKPPRRSGPKLPVKMIISGGQTGVDRAALEVAIELDIPHGGWCPRGRLAEDGPIAKHYKLKETASRLYYVRTELNVKEATGTLILFRGKLTSGTALTQKYAIRQHKPCLCLNLQLMSSADVAARIRAWLIDNRIQILNVAGPRASSAPGIGDETHDVLREVFRVTKRVPKPRVAPKRLVANAKRVKIRG